MAITELPPAPTSGNPTNFSNKGDALLGSFATFITQTNSTSADVDTKSTNVDTKSTNVDTKQQQASIDEASALASKNSASASASVIVTKANDCVVPTDTTIAKALEASNSELSALASAITANNTVLNVVSNRASIRPTLLLDFAKTKFMDPRVTFTRSSVATVTDSLGVIRTVASDVPRFDHDPVTGESLGLLMEEQRTNLLIYSDNFDVGWNKVGSVRVIPYSAIAPNGTFTAASISKSSAFSGIDQSITATLNSHFGGIYAKAGSSSNCTLRLTENGSASIIARGNINLVTGAVTQVSGATVTATSIGNGWWRIGSVVTTTFTSLRLNFYSGVDNDSDTGNIYIWRGGLEVGAFPTSSIETPAVFTGRSSTGTFIGSNGLIQTAASGVARYQYTPTDSTIPPYLLLETASTNLFLQSQTLSNSSWTKVNAAVSSVTDSDLSWQTNRITATDTAFPRAQQNITLDAGSTYALSILVKAGSVNFMHGTVEASSVSQTLRFYANLTTGATSQVTGQGTISATSSRKLISGGYYLYTWVVAIPSTAGYIAFFGPSSSYQSNPAAINDYIDVGYAQIELGSYATSAIPTTSSQVTRAADTSTSSQVTRAADSAVMTGVNFSSWYRTDEGTMYGELAVLSLPTTGTSTALQLRSSFTTGNQLTLRFGSVISGSDYLVQANNGTSVDSNSFTVSNNIFAKYAYSYKLNNFAVTKDSSTPFTDSSGLVPVSIDEFRIASNAYCGQIRKIAFYPKSLSNTELVGITQ
jgi:hypothetical protein